MKVKSLSHIQLLATPWTAAFQAPPSMGFSRQEYWSGVPLPSPASSLTILQNNVKRNLNKYNLLPRIQNDSYCPVSKFPLILRKGRSFPGSSVGKEFTCNPGGTGDMDSLLGQEDTLGEGIATHSSILAWTISWTEEPVRL